MPMKHFKFQVVLKVNVENKKSLTQVLETGKFTLNCPVQKGFKVLIGGKEIEINDVIINLVEDYTILRYTETWPNYYERFGDGDDFMKKASAKLDEMVKKYAFIKRV